MQVDLAGGGATRTAAMAFHWSLPSSERGATASPLSSPAYFTFISDTPPFHHFETGWLRGNGRRRRLE